ncbi:ABC transporter permease [Actinoplanes italicus]|uniref:Carbohydrate ABC transporter membrane protein 1 (CUT1 family) n=1 Tax=Actinoplanes italicus TaxID=113567 RepID=A0A2T0K1A5_9ACTN|nr:sugar ABC transporter permease [Actinoplanes italicus]PRX16546.1 carbohydrate ABC transporter membrane protein 1 (CUT1 family) [Actinoplanes italicus]GIE33751.1 ABC transporter permease [Actinoplanes italicus]
MTSQLVEVRPAVTAGRRRRRPKFKHYPWLYVAPALILLLTFTYVPVGNMLFYSFHKWDGLDVTMDPVGFGNYVKVFTDERYWRVFLISLYYFAASFAQIAIALYFAVVLSFETRFRNLFKGILFFPYLLNGVAVGFVFLYLFQPDGTLDTVLRLVGLGEHTKLWLGDPDVANLSLAGTSVWRFTGLNFVLFLGAIQSIPGEIYEAAEIDGANRWHQFWHIIAPGIRRIISLSFILAISGSLSVFEIPFIMTSGANGTRTFVIQAYETAFQFRQIGLASAMAVVLLLLVLLVTWIQRRVLPDEEVNLS